MPHFVAALLTLGLVVLHMHSSAHAETGESTSQSWRSRPIDRESLDQMLLLETTHAWQDLVARTERSSQPLNFGQRALAFDILYGFNVLKKFEHGDSIPFLGWVKSPRLSGNSTLMAALGKISIGERQFVHLSAADYMDSNFSFLARIPDGRSLVIIDDFPVFYLHEQGLNQLLHLIDERTHNALVLAVDDSDNSSYGLSDPRLMDRLSFVVDGEQSAGVLCTHLLADHILPSERKVPLSSQ